MAEDTLHEKLQIKLLESDPAIPAISHLCTHWQQSVRGEMMVDERLQFAYASPPYRACPVGYMTCDMVDVSMPVHFARHLLTSVIQ